MIRCPVIFPKMDMGTLQALRKIVLFAFVGVGVVLFAVTDSSYPDDSFVRHAIESGGILLIIICIIGRTWSSFYIGGRKIVELVHVGPYSIVRNPLYFFSIIGAVGVGAQVGSVAVAFICAFVSFVIFTIVTQHEERLLLRMHRHQFVVYFRRVPRFVPDITLWRDEPVIAIRPYRVFMTFADALLFLLAVPLAWICKYLQSTGALPVLITLP